MLQPIKQSTTALGKAFERHCQLLLTSQLRMDLTHVGGKGDRGIDLRGWWKMPCRPEQASSIAETETAGGMRERGGSQLERRIRVLVQCKAEKTKAGPRLIRELEGTWRQAVSEQASLGSTSASDWATPLPSGGQASSSLTPAVAVACSASGFSTAAAQDLTRSNIPMLLLHVPLEGMTTDVLEPDSSSEDEDGDVALPEAGSRSNVGTADVMEGDGSKGDSYYNSSPIKGATWNQALLGPTGILGPGIDLRWTFPSRDGDSQSGRRRSSEIAGGHLRLFEDGKEYQGQPKRSKSL